MGLMDLLRKMTTVKVDGLLDRMEDPELMLPQLMKEFAQKVEVAANAEAKALSAVRASQRRVDESRGRVLRLTQGAELAVKKRDESLAREVLAAQIAEEEALVGHQRGLDVAERARRDAGEVRKGLVHKLQELTDRNAELMLRAKSLGVARRTQALDADARRMDVQVRAMEGQVLEAATASDLQRDLTLDSTANSAVTTERKLAALEKDAAVEDRLRRLRENRST